MQKKNRFKKILTTSAPLKWSWLFQVPFIRIVTLFEDVFQFFTFFQKERNDIWGNILLKSLATDVFT